MGGKFMEKSTTSHQVMAIAPLNLIQFMMGFGNGFAPVLQSLTKLTTLNRVEISLVGSLYYAGRAFGPFVQSALIDRVGRKRLFVMAASLCCLQYAVLALCPLQLTCAHYATRIAFGLASGIVDSAKGIYIAETCSPFSRGVFNGVGSTFYSLGMLVAFSLHTCLDYAVVNVCALLFAAVTLASCFALLTEPAHYLLMEGRVEEARRNFEWLRGCSSAAQQEFDEVRDYIERVRNERAQTLAEKLSSRAARKSLTVVIVMVVLMMMTGVPAVDNYFTTIFETDHVTIIYGAIGVALQIVGASVIELFDRRAMCLFSNVVIALTFVATALLFVFEKDAVAAGIVDRRTMYAAQFITLSLGVKLYHAIMAPVMGAVGGELLPQHVKGIVSALSIVVAAAVGFCLSSVFLTVKDHLGVQYNFCVFAFFAVVAFFYTYCRLPETRGKTLVQIQAELQLQPQRRPSENVKNECPFIRIA